VSQTSNGNQIRSVSAFDSIDRSANRIAVSAASTNRCSPERRLIAAMSNTRPTPATLPNPIAHTTEAQLAQLQY
jgi:hypothetical protein